MMRARESQLRQRLCDKVFTELTILKKARLAMKNLNVGTGLLSKPIHEYQSDSSSKQPVSWKIGKKRCEKVEKKPIDIGRSISAVC